MKFFVLGLGWTVILSAVGEENSAQRLESAQRGVAEASWPRKPDDRLSPLSGKMKESREISMRYFGQEKEFRARPADGWLREAGLGRRAKWEGVPGRNWEEARWGQGADSASNQGENETFRPERDLATDRTLAQRELVRESAAGWASRAANLGAGRGGSLRMYEGRLTRVREQVWQEQAEGRDLGPGRQEKFSPHEVERMLADPVGRVRGAAREQSPAASPLAAAGS